MSIGQKFTRFCDKIKIDKDDLENISDRYHKITKRINIDFWNSNSDVSHSLYVGSFGRDTEIFSSDIDMLVQLPYETYNKYDNYQGNGQSALLQDIKKSIEKTYSHSNLKGDGQIISFPFSDGINFEILPAFLNEDGSYTFANSNNGGSWKITDPKAEIEAINDLNKICNGNLKKMCRMIRSWKNYNNVDISGILIDNLCYKFLKDWEHRSDSLEYFDWLTRDFFKYLSEIDVNQSVWYVMGSGRKIIDNGYFQYKAKQAYNASLEAIEYEKKDYEWSANEKWREIYGTKFS